MAETPIEPTETEGDGIDPEVAGPAPQIGIEAQYIKDLSFENPIGPGAQTALEKEPEVEVEVTTSARAISEGRYEVCLIMRGQATAEGNTFFIVELTYGGIISLANVPEEAIEPVLLIEGARLLFPFARNIVADVTRDGGFPPLFLSPIDFVALYRQQHQGKAAAEASGEV